MCVTIADVVVAVVDDVVVAAVDAAVDAAVVAVDEPSLRTKCPR